MTLVHTSQILQPLPLRTPADILDWLQRQHTLHRAVHAFYAGDCYFVQITHDDCPIPNAEWRGKTLQEAYSTAMAHWDLTHGARDLLAERTVDAQLATYAAGSADLSAPIDGGVPDVVVP